MENQDKREKTPSNPDFRWKELDVEKLKRGLPELHRAMESLRRAGKVSREFLDTEINI